MTVSAKEVALAAKAKKDEEARRREANDRAEARALADNHRTMCLAVNEALNEVRELPGVSVAAGVVQVGDQSYKLSVDLERGKMRWSDESPEVDYANYVIHWRDSNGAVYGGHSDPESFKKGFGEFIGERL